MLTLLPVLAFTLVPAPPPELLAVVLAGDFWLPPLIVFLLPEAGFEALAPPLDETEE